MTNKVFYIEGHNTPDSKVCDFIERGWTVYNAPRPLLGNEVWQGEFRHGIFYAAVMPAGAGIEMEAYAEQGYHKRNQELDGYTCEIITKEAVMAYGAKVAEDYNRNLADFEYDDIVKSFIGWLGRQ